MATSGKVPDRMRCDSCSKEIVQGTHYVLSFNDWMLFTCKDCLSRLISQAMDLDVDVHEMSVSAHHWEFKCDCPVPSPEF